MKRRNFLKTVTAAAVGFRVLGWPQLLKAATDPLYAKDMPSTPFTAPKGSWTLAVLPDTQNYSSRFPEVFQRQCEWIVAHREKHNILFVAHEGDIVNEQKPEQWKNAREAMNILNAAQMPYSLLPGNHDLGPLGHFCQDRSTLLNGYFNAGDYTASKVCEIFEPGKMENSWHAFETPHGPYGILALEYGPRDEAVKWGADLVTKNAECKVALVTHAYLYCDSTRYGEPKPGATQRWNPKNNPGLHSVGSVNDGHDLWTKLVAPSSNVQFTLNGHVLNNGTGYLESRAGDGHAVHQILANYQAGVQIDDGAGGTPYDGTHQGGEAKGRAFGGGGFLRLMQFHPDRKTVAVRTYSPWYDRWLAQPDQQFNVTLS